MVRKRVLIVGVLFLVVAFAGNSTAQEKPGSHIKIWEEPLTIPSYKVEKPDSNPRFYDGRAYQGAQGRVYPYPMLERKLASPMLPITILPLEKSSGNGALVLPGVSGTRF